MDTTDLPPALRQDIAAINSQVAAAETTRAEASAALATLQARIAAADDAQRDLDAIMDQDAGSALSALAGGTVIDHDLRRLVDQVQLHRQAADAAGRAIPKAEAILNDAEADLTELIDSRKALVADALVIARDDLISRYNVAADQVRLVAAHLAGLEQAATETAGIAMRLPDGVGTLAIAQRPESRDGVYVEPDAIQWSPLTMCADPVVAATSKAAWLSFADRLAGGAS